MIGWGDTQKWNDIAINFFKTEKNTVKLCNNYATSNSLSQTDSLELSTGNYKLLMPSRSIFGQLAILDFTIASAFSCFTILLDIRTKNKSKQLHFLLLLSILIIPALVFGYRFYL